MSDNRSEMEQSADYLARQGWGARRVGKTTRLAQVAKELNGVLVCHSGPAAKDARETHGCSAISVMQGARVLGRNGPVIFEPEAVSVLLSDLLDTICGLERELTTIRAAYKQAVTERDQWAEKWEQEYHRSIERGVRKPGLPDDSLNVCACDTDPLGTESCDVCDPKGLRRR